MVPNTTTRVRRKDAPKPDEIRKAREDAGLSRKDAAALIYSSERGWIKWERGERRMHPAFWHLFRLLSE